LIINLENNTPGPGHYQPKPLIDGSGATFVSRFKSSTAKSLSGRFKELSNKNQSEFFFYFSFLYKILYKKYDYGLSKILQ